MTAIASALLKANEVERRFTLRSQMRVRAGADYVGYIRRVLSDDPPRDRIDFEGYDLRLFDSLADLRATLQDGEADAGLARLVAGYAWRWTSRRDARGFDIELDGEHLRWNSTSVDWVNSLASREEVGSIHTIQGYDLNYAGVIIGNDLRYDAVGDRLWFDRANYHDTKGKENNRRLGRVYSNADLLRYVENIYAVRLTRGIRGTYVFAADPPLREYLRRYL